MELEGDHDVWDYLNPTLNGGGIQAYSGLHTVRDLMPFSWEEGQDSGSFVFQPSGYCGDVHDYTVGWTCPFADFELQDVRLMLDEENDARPCNTHYNENPYVCDSIRNLAVVVAPHSSSETGSANALRLTTLAFKTLDNWNDAPESSNRCAGLEFRALSHIWGSETSQVIKRFVAPLSARLAGRTRASNVCIDSCCIDQTKRSEIRRQVQVMPDVYKGAAFLLQDVEVVERDSGRALWLRHMLNTLLGLGQICMAIPIGLYRPEQEIGSLTGLSVGLEHNRNLLQGVLYVALPPPTARIVIEPDSSTFASACLVFNLLVTVQYHVNEKNTFQKPFLGVGLALGSLFSVCTGPATDVLTIASAVMPILAIICLVASQVAEVVRRYLQGDISHVSKLHTVQSRCPHHNVTRTFPEKG